MSLEILECELKKIIFQNDNGYVVGAFFVKFCGEISAIGDMVAPQKGAKYRLHGKWVEHKQYGRQFNYESYETVEPKSKVGIHRYIVHTAKWVGPKTGTAIVEEYGKETLEILKTNPEVVADKIRGVTLARALEIQEMLLQNENIEHLMVQLETIIGDLGLRKTLPTEIIKKWGSKSLDIIKQNPYTLCELDKVGFLTADKIALERLKIPIDSIFRKRAAIKYTMKENENEGNVWIEINDLVNRTDQLLGCSCVQALQDAAKEDLVVDERRFIANKKAANDERYIAEKLKRMLI